MSDMKEEGMDSDSPTIVRLRGLPWNASKADIIEFFPDCEIEGGEDGIHLMTNREGRPSGEAYVNMSSPDDLTKAKEKHNKHMGKRYIEVFPATTHEMDWVMKRSGAPACNDGDAVVRLRGLPFEATKEEVAHFFSGLEIKPKGITFVKKLDDRRDGGKFDQKGRHSGSAFVQFKSPEIAEQALKKDRAYMGPRYVEVFKSSEEELAQVTQQQRMQGMRPFPNRPGPYDRMDMRMGGGMMGRPGRGGRMGMKPYRDFSDNGYYDDEYDYDGYGMGDGSYGMGSRRGGGGGGGYSGGMMNRSSGYGNQSRMGMGMGMGRSGSGSGGGGSVNRGSPGWQYQSCTGHHVHMRGLPYTATEKDIHDFFSGVQPVHVEIHLKPNRQATGEADVEFSCHEDAKMAFTRDRQMMSDRYIELFLHSQPGCDFSGGNMDSDMMGSGGGGGYGNNSMGSGGSGSGYGNSGNYFGSGMSGGSGMGGMGSMSSSRLGFGSGGSSMNMGGNNYTPFS
ncbi:heterogeneous nuclear ribonucleoprotein H3-like isoform X2 [Lineus longissimus]